jgi:hypothetical protein
MRLPLLGSIITSLMVFQGGFHRVSIAVDILSIVVDKDDTIALRRGIP